MIQITSKGTTTSEKYAGSMGEYQLLQDISFNGRPVYQSLARNDRYILYIGKLFIL